MQPCHFGRISRIAPTKCNNQWNFFVQSNVDYPSVTYSQAVLGKLQATKLIVNIGVNTSLVMNEVELSCICEKDGKCFIQCSKILFVASTRG